MKEKIEDVIIISVFLLCFIVPIAFVVYHEVRRAQAIHDRLTKLYENCLKYEPDYKCEYLLYR